MSLNIRILCAALGLLGMSPLALAHKKDETTPAGETAAKDKKGKKAATAPRSFAQKPAPGTRATCAVSGEEFTVDEKTQFATHDGRVYAFCCSDCVGSFEKEPAKYADKK